ncbi:MAG: hypothetical protein PUA62_00625 [Lachnospiraceae bacterium]|nr:hypothetical protein [Lachnospiraceae bacterium]
MSVIYRYRKNLIYAILIHQMVNFSLDILFTGDLLEIFVPFAVLYVAVAIVIGIGYVKRERKGGKTGFPAPDYYPSEFLNSIK